MTPCRVEAELHQHEKRLERNEKREAAIRAEWPLSEFEGAAFDLLMSEGLASHLDEVAMQCADRLAVCACGLRRSEYGTIELACDEDVVRAAIKRKLADICETLQDKHVKEEW